MLLGARSPSDNCNVCAQYWNVVLNGLVGETVLKQVWNKDKSGSKKYWGPNKGNGKSMPLPPPQQPRLLQPALPAAALRVCRGVLKAEARHV